MSRAGGTGLGHEVNFARAPAMFGPYEGAPNNPLLTAANTTNFCICFTVVLAVICLLIFG